MRTIVLTEAEHYRLTAFLGDMLSVNSWLGSKFVQEGSTENERVSLMNIKHKLQEAKRNA